MSSKEKILEFLESNRNEYMSGASMASSLGLSRNAIWKAINELRRDGYTIDAISNKGYKLACDTDIISAAGIIAGLNDKLSSIYKEDPELIKVLDQTTSTNRIAKECAIADLKHGTLVVANEQTAGRGRGNHNFYSPRGGLYMSVIMTPEHLSYKSSDQITTFIGNSVCNAISSISNLNPRLKPINDLFIGNKKICGILTEAGTEFETGLLQWIVVGIGINFSTDINAMPTDIKKTATSLLAEGATGITRNQLVAEILNRIL